MGRVWRATDVVLHRDVAIKELVPPPGLTPGERQEMRERSLREARAIARLNNINVVRVFDVLRTDADPWIVMEYVASRSLQDTLAADGPFNPVRAAEIGLGVLNALRAAHRAGVVHRDVKPGNVLLGADGRVVLTDFGLATVPGDPNVTRTGLVLGSPAYIAPERARDGTAGPAADLWSLGATLFAAVEGQSPFARPSAIATLAALATENPPPSRAAGPLKPVLNGLLRKDPAHRINAEEAERLLSRAAGRRARVTFPMSPTMRRPGAGRERPSLPSGPGGPPVLPGSGFATGSAPVVPNPRPPVTATPPPGRPTFASGKASVSGQAPADTPPRATRPGSKPLDATRLDTPPVQDPSGTPKAPRTGQSAPPAGPPATAPVSPARIGFTAADVAANRRRQAAPEHERSLAAATGAYPIVPTPSDSAQATTVMPAGGAPAGGAPAGGEPASEDATTVMPKGAAPATEDATTVMPSGGPQTGTKPTESASAESGSVSSAPAGTPSADQKAAAAVTAAEAQVSDTKTADAEADEAATGQEAKSGAAGTASTATESTSDEKSGEGSAAEAEATAAEPDTDERKPTADSASKAATAGAGEDAQASDDANASEADSPATAGAAEQAKVSENEQAEVEADEQAKAEADEPAKAEADEAANAKAAGQPKGDTDEPAKAPEPVQKPAAADEATSVIAAPEVDADKTSFVDLTAVVPPARTAQPAGDDATRVVGDLGAVPQFSRPNRPAWTPMPVREGERRTGITVLGTTLTKRQAAVGLGILLTFLLLVGIILVQAFGDEGTTPDGNSAKPAAAATGKPGSGKPSAGGSATPSSAAPTSGGAVPNGWHTYKGSGFSFPVPDSVKGSGGGTGLMLEWKNRLVRVDKIEAPLGDPVKFLEEQQSSHYRNYRKIGITPVEYHGKAADWEFTYTTDSGSEQRVVRRAFAVDGQTFLLSWYTQQKDWDAAKKDFEVIKQAFDAS